MLRNRKASDEEIAGEVRHYLDEATAKILSPKGLSPDEARPGPHGLEMGTAAAAIGEQVREYGWENRIDAFLFSGLRYAVRRLRFGNPGFTADQRRLRLALGIGASTAIFSVMARAFC